MNLNDVLNKEFVGKRIKFLEEDMIDIFPSPILIKSLGMNLNKQ